MNMSHEQRTFAFAGRLYAGKDYVAEQAGLKKIGFADPMYEIAKYFHGTTDKSAPGIRRFLQLIGQWGWGHTDPDCSDYHYTVERANMTGLVRTLGREGAFQGFPDEIGHWRNYGLDRSFWVNILDRRLREMTEDAAIVNIRFEHEIGYAKSRGIPVYLVWVSKETQLERLAAHGVELTEKELKDKSEQFCEQLRYTLPAENIIWNDHRPMEDSRFLSVEDFVNLDVNGEIN